MQIIGIDEVGRGCWAGPLLAAAVILDDRLPITGLNDSKKLSKAQREKLDISIREQALAIGIGWVWPAEIDRFGLTAAVRLAMLQAVQQTSQQITMDDTEIIIDGSYNFLAEYPRVKTMVRADGLIPAVSAASIVAKVARDNYMATVAAVDYPAYNFEKHVGYGTDLHIDALQRHGVTAIHRISYKPIRQFLLQSDI